MRVVLKKSMVLLLCTGFLFTNCLPVLAAEKSESYDGSLSVSQYTAPKKCSSCNIAGMEANFYHEGWSCYSCVKKFIEKYKKKELTATQKARFASGIQTYIGYVQQNMRNWNQRDKEAAVKLTKEFTASLGLPRNVLYVNSNGEPVDVNHSHYLRKKIISPILEEGEALRLGIYLQKYPNRCVLPKQRKQIISEVQQAL